MNHPLVNLLVRWLVLALGVAISAKVVPGIGYADGMTLVVVVALLSVFNAFLKPLIVLFTLPFVVLSLGFGVWLINALLFLLVSKLVDGFRVDGWWPALWGALIVSVTNFVLSRLLARTAPPPAAPRPPPARRDDVIDI
jgi:putative membrane protein